MGLNVDSSARDFLPARLRSLASLYMCVCARVYVHTYLCTYRHVYGISDGKGTFCPSDDAVTLTLSTVQENRNTIQANAIVSTFQVNGNSG